MDDGFLRENLPGESPRQFLNRDKAMIQPSLLII